MKQLMDLLWGMGAGELVVGTFEWFIVFYVLWQIHQEINIWRAIRHTRNMKRQF